MGLGGQHARQVGGAAGAGDDGLQAALGSGFCVLEQQVGSTVGGDDAGFTDDAEVLSTRAAFCMTSQSLLLPITMPTSIMAEKLAG